METVHALLIPKTSLDKVKKSSAYSI